MLGEDIVVCIVGNKIDLEKNRTVSKSEAERYISGAQFIFGHDNILTKAHEGHYIVLCFSSKVHM